MALADNLVAYWKMDETSGTREDSFASFDLTDNNSVTSTNGVINEAAYFTAANSEYLSHADNASLRAGDVDFGWMAWVSLHSKGADRRIVSKRDAVENNDYDLFYSNTGDQFEFYIADSDGTQANVAATALGSPSLDATYCIFAWFDASANTINIQVNNGTVNSAAATLSPISGTADLYIGNLEQVARYWDGWIDEVAYWRGGFPSSDGRSLLYNSGSGLAYPWSVDVSLGVIDATLTPSPVTVTTGTSGNPVWGDDLSIKVELELNDTWTDVTRDCAWSRRMQAQSGIWTQQPTSLVASPGTFRFELDNSELNSAGTVGYYTPGSSDARSGFCIGAKARLAISYAGDWVRWAGRIKKAVPSVGLYGDLITKIECGDWISESSRIRPRGIEVQSDKTGDELMTALLAAVDNQPEGTDFDVGRSTFPTAFDDVRDGVTTLYSAMNNVAGSEWGHANIKGDGTLMWQNRYAYYGIPSSDAVITLTGTGQPTDITGLTLSDDDMIVYNNILGRVYPRTVDTDASVLWELQSSSQSIPAGETMTYIGDYRDPNNLDSRVGGADMVSPVEGTDYACTGADSDLSVTATLGGNSAEIAITNNSAEAVTLTTLQVRGKRVVTYDPVAVQASDSDSIETHGDRDLNLLMPYQDSANVGRDFADWALTQYKDARLRPRTVSFLANKSDTILLAALTAEPGDIVTIDEPFFSGDCVITGTKYKISKYNLIDVTWAIEPKPTVSFFALNDSLLDGDDQLAF